MAEKHNTGNYQVCRNQIGIGNSIEILKTGSKEEIDKFWNELKQEGKFNYYKNEEVFYSGTQKDESGKDIDSTPGFQRMQ